MSIIETKTRYTPEDLLSMEDAGGTELVDGELVESNMGFESSWVAMRIGRFLDTFCAQRQLGWIAGADAGYQCFPQFPGMVRKPDVSFIRLGRLPGEKPPKGHCPIPPDLAVEVVSPNDLAYEVDRKVQLYLSVGVRLVWVVNPDVRIVRVYRSDGSMIELREQDELSGGDVLPDFRCPIREIFPIQTVEANERIDDPNKT